MDKDGLVDTSAEAALKALNDIVVPTPVSYMPQTWGWAALAILLLAVFALLAWRWLRRWKANRYRREALAALDALARQAESSATPAGVEQELAELLKRTALGAWPREEVAKLSGAAWAEFLAAHSGESADPVLSALVDEQEYRAPDAGELSAKEQARMIAAVRKWIEGHYVST